MTPDIIVGDLFFPEERLRKNLGLFYFNHPVMARAVIIPIYAVTGLLETLLLPLVALVGSLALPLIALGQTCREGGNPLPYLKVWAFSLFTLAACCTLLALSVHTLTLQATAGVYIGGGALLISFKVHRASQAPKLMFS